MLLYQIPLINEFIIYCSKLLKCFASRNNQLFYNCSMKMTDVSGRYWVVTVSYMFGENMWQFSTRSLLWNHVYLYPQIHNRYYADLTDNTHCCTLSFCIRSIVVCNNFQSLIPRYKNNPFFYPFCLLTVHIWAAKSNIWARVFVCNLQR
jgi:hypothetical protein